MSAANRSTIASPAAIRRSQQIAALDDGGHHHGLTKAIDIATAIDMVDDGLERLRRQRGKKKAGKNGKAVNPQLQDASLAQTLVVAKAHLEDYRRQVMQPTPADLSIAEGTSHIAAEKILVGLSPFHTPAGKKLQEPHEPIDKAKAVLNMLMGCQDEETSESTLYPDDLAWGLLLVHDLLIEARKRAEGYQDHCHALYEEISKRIAHYSLVEHDCAETPHRRTAQEVQQ
jgi:hypothetical protein